MRRALPGIAFAGMMLGAAWPTWGTVLCVRKKSAVVSVRSARCRTSESPVDGGMLAPKGPPGAPGDAGAAAPARGYAHVDNEVNVVSGAHVMAVERVATGIYCLTPDDTIDAASSLGVASPEYGYSAGSDLVVYVHTPATACPSTAFQVDTVDRNGVASSAVAFVFVVL